MQSVVPNDNIVHAIFASSGGVLKRGYLAHLDNNGKPLCGGGYSGRGPASYWQQAVGVSNCRSCIKIQQKVTCIHPECLNTSIRARGLCGLHYQQWQKEKN